MFPNRKVMLLGTILTFCWIPGGKVFRMDPIVSSPAIALLAPVSEIPEPSDSTVALMLSCT